MITREGAMDELLVRIEADATAFTVPETMRDAAQRVLHKMLGLRARVEICPPGTFPRTDFKARRVVDDREVFREMNQRLAGAGARDAGGR